MTISQINEELNRLSGNNPEFYSSIIPGSKPILGVRVPELRRLAQRIAKEDYKTFLKENPMDNYEQEMLQAFVIGYAKDDIDVLLGFFQEMIPCVHDWAVNDALCQTFKICRRHPQRVWDFLMKYRDSEETYEVRVVAVMLLSHYLTDEYIDRTIEVLNSLKTREYYSQMAVAWAIATVMAKYPDKCEAYMKRPDNGLDDWTFNKAIQKMRESFRVSEEMKARMKEIKRV